VDREADPTADLVRLVADTRQADASRARARERILRQQAAEETTLLAVLLDLCEARADVTIAVACGRTIHGRLRSIGRDFVVVSTGGTDTIAPMTEITSIRGGPNIRDAEPSGHRTNDLGSSLAAHLGGLAPERPHVTIVPRGGGNVLNGELRAAGADVLVVHVDGAAPATAYVPLPSVSLLTVWAG
jgi:hypothetical protein